MSKNLQMIGALMASLPIHPVYCGGNAYSQVMDNGRVVLRDEPMGKRARRRMRGKMKNNKHETESR